MNVKRGDLVIVVKCAEVPENIGIICRVNRFVGYDEDYQGVIYQAWEASTEGRSFKFLDGDECDECLIEDSSLRPVSGIPDTESTDEHLTKPVTQPEKEIA